MLRHLTSKLITSGDCRRAPVFIELFVSVLFCTATLATWHAPARACRQDSRYDGVLYKSDTHPFSVVLPPGWAASETEYFAAGHGHVFFCMNNRGLTDLRVTDKMTRIGHAYDADVVQRQLLPGTVYIDFVISDRLLLTSPSETRPDDSFEKRMEEFLDGRTPPLWVTPELTAYRISFSRREEHWSIFLFFREPVPDSGKARAFAVLGSLKLYDLPIVTKTRAVEAAVKYLPHQADPEREWPRGTARVGRYATSVSKNREGFFINFTLYKTDGSNDTLNSFDYRVSRDGYVWVLDTGSGYWNALERPPKPRVRITSNDFDVDRDGSPDFVCFTSEPGRYEYREFTLTVNDAVYEGRGNNLDAYYEIVDIDTTDALQEIIVPESGPSGDYATQFFYYDGRDITAMGKLPGTPGVYGLKVDGSGVIDTRQRGRILHTWFYPARYRLTEAHELEFIRQNLYEMNYKVTLKVELPLQVAPCDTATVTILLPGDEVTILASDDERWCLAETSDGKRGWFAVEDYSEIVGTGKWAYEVFEGLCFAD